MTEIWPYVLGIAGASEIALAIYALRRHGRGSAAAADDPGAGRRDASGPGEGSVS